LESLQENKTINEKNQDVINRFLQTLTTKNGHDTLEFEKAMNFIRQETRKGTDGVVLLYEILQLIHRQKNILEVHGKPTQYCPDSEKE
jgi:hypothetical protein